MSEEVIVLKEKELADIIFKAIKKHYEGSYFYIKATKFDYEKNLKGGPWKILAKTEITACGEDSYVDSEEGRIKEMLIESYKDEEIEKIQFKITEKDEGLLNPSLEVKIF